MDSGQQIHPSRRPDPERVKKWRHEIEIVSRDVTDLLWTQEVMRRFAEFVRGNDAILHGQSDFPAVTRRWYRDSAAMAIRRLVDQGSEGPVYSLRLVLEDMKRACEAFTRNSVDGLLDEPGAPKYEAEFRAFLVSSAWENVKDPKLGTDRLRSDALKSDLQKLEQSSKRSKQYADLRIAHHSKSELPDSEAPTWNEMDECIDVIHEITKRWIAPLTGAGYSSMVPVFQGNWYDIFVRVRKSERSA